jgi:beta-glucosidase
MGTQNVIFAEGLPYSRAKDQGGFHEAINAAGKSDVVILCVGEESILSGEAHSRASLELPGAQNDLIKAVASAGKPVILVVIAGRPLAIGDITPYADAVLYAFHFGSMGGAALAELLLGDISPSGKLPVTFPKSAGQIPFYYNHKNTGRPTVPGSWVNIDDIPVNAVQTSLGNTSNYLDLGYQPLYPFGYGLSYTTFEYSRLNVETPVVEMGGEISASVTVTNIGNYAADEVVQLYIRDLAGSITRPVKELKGFQRIHLEPNKSAQVQFKISTHDLSFFNQQMEEVTEPGDFSLWIGGSSATTLKSSFSIQ